MPTTRLDATGYGRPNRDPSVRRYPLDPRHSDYDSLAGGSGAIGVRKAQPPTRQNLCAEDLGWPCLIRDAIWAAVSSVSYAASISRVRGRIAAMAARFSASS